MHANNTKPDKSLQALDRPLKLTRFPSQRALAKKELHLSLRELADQFQHQTAASKDKLPWFKLATFGNDKSAKGCLRTNANVATVTGLEADYDAGRMTPEEARDKLAKAGVAALIYTTPSHTTKAPRWRVFCPLSGPLPPDAREDHMAELNGILGGVLAGESFTLSQAYYAGNVEGRAKVQTFLVDGRHIDTATGMKPIYKDGGKTKPERVASTGEKTGLPFAELKDAMMHVPNDDTNAKADDREWWLGMLAALHHETDGGEKGLELAHDWSALHPSYDPEATDAAWESFRRGSGKTGATILSEAQFNGWIDVSALDDCWTPEELAAIAREALDANTQDDIERLVGIPAKPPANINWGTPMMRGDKPVINLYNTTVFLGRDLDSILPGLAHNRMTGRDEWRDGQLTDAVVSVARMALERRGLETVGKDLVADAAKTVALKLAYHPIRDQLNALRWDGTPRLDSWLVRHAAADDTPYTRAVGRKFMLAMVARVMDPGCKHDHTLVLSGEQGQNKSTAWCPPSPMRVGPSWRRNL